MFLASMTHELRTPLNSIVGFSDLLGSVDTPEERSEFIRIIRNNCDMLLRLINDILEASSIHDGPQSIVPKDKQEAVFERFVKLDEFVQGAGLGLAICQSIAERCNGYIGVDSEGEGHGSTFWIWLPCERRVNAQHVFIGH